MVERTEHDYRTSNSSEEIEPHRSHGGDEIAGLEKRSTAASGYSAFEQRTHSIVSRIRSREPGQTAKFNHPLTHSKTSPDVIVDFEGPDDPYRPLNWGFKKKAITTVLYGLTTMGMYVRGQCRGNGELWGITLMAVINCRFDVGEFNVSPFFCFVVYRLLN